MSCCCLKTCCCFSLACGTPASGRAFALSSVLFLGGRGRYPWTAPSLPFELQQRGSFRCRRPCFSSWLSFPSSLPDPGKPPAADPQEAPPASAQEGDHPPVPAFPGLLTSAVGVLTRLLLLLLPWTPNCWPILLRLGLASGAPSPDGACTPPQPVCHSLRGRCGTWRGSVAGWCGLSAGPRCLSLWPSTAHTCPLDPPPTSGSLRPPCNGPQSNPPPLQPSKTRGRILPGAPPRPSLPGLAATVTAPPPLGPAAADVLSSSGQPVSWWEVPLPWLLPSPWPLVASLPFLPGRFPRLRPGPKLLASLSSLLSFVLLFLIAFALLPRDLLRSAGQRRPFGRDGVFTASPFPTRVLLAPSAVPVMAAARASSSVFVPSSFWPLCLVPAVYSWTWPRSLGWCLTRGEELQPMCKVMRVEVWVQLPLLLLSRLVCFGHSLPVLLLLLGSLASAMVLSSRFTFVLSFLLRGVLTDLFLFFTFLLVRVCRAGFLGLHFLSSCRPGGPAACLPLSRSRPPFGLDSWVDVAFHQVR